MSAQMLEMEKQEMLNWSAKLAGQTHFWPRMTAAIASGRYPHCSMILGVPGNGQLLTALSVAQHLLCEINQTACGTCNSCIKARDLNHPDLLFTFPLPGGKESCDELFPAWRKALAKTPFMTITEWVEQLEKEGKNANINVKEIKSFIDKVYLKPYEAALKVAIIWLPEYLGKEGNRLLKLLEEPPEHSYIILVAEQKELILPTILSRAQIFVMERLEISAVHAYLKNTHGLNDEQALTIASFCDGNMQAALDASQKTQELGIEMIQQLFQKCYQYDVNGITEWTEGFSNLNKEDQKNTLVLLQQILSFALRFKFGTETHQVENSVYLYAKKISASLSLNAIDKLVEWSDDAYFAIYRYGHVKLTMLSFCLKISQMLNTKK